MLKEKALASALVKAAYLDPKESRDAANALNWRGDSTSKTAGNFAKTMYEVRLQGCGASLSGAHLLHCSCPLALCTALQTALCCSSDTATAYPRVACKRLAKGSCS